MSGKKITYYTLIAFLIGSIILTYVQYDSARNINALISGNEKLLEEFGISSELKTLEKDIFAVESKIRGIITTSNAQLGEGTAEKITEIHAKLEMLHEALDDDTSHRHLQELDSLVKRKLRWSGLLLETYKTKGKRAAEDLIATQKGRFLTDSITASIERIDAARKQYLKETISQIDNTGQQAKRLNALIIITLLAGAAIFLWYTINSARKQSRLIYELNISEKKVKESALVKERFLANMSHEIRTPLNAILGFINLLQKKDLDKESAEYVDTVRRSSENLLNIVNDILDLSKIEAHMMRVETAPFSIRGLIHSVQNMFVSKTNEKNIALAAETDPTLPDILEGDATKLTQVLINLIGNAIKFTHGGKITVKITNEGIQDGNVLTGIAISDTGIGIDADKLGHIFERFRQAEDSVNRNYGGTGLGLTIVHELITLQKGTIRVESEPGKGTTFYVQLPYRIAPQEQANEAEMQNMAEAADFSALKLLVAEDNEINQKLIKHLFRNWNLAYDMVSNGNQAIEALKATQYDLVLMDIQMPEKDGYTATQEIRGTLGVTTPIIAMTAHAFAGEREKCLSYGMNDYISKPIKENKLHELIARFAKTTVKQEKAPTAAPAGNSSYNYIALDYMKEISGGDTDYEKIITEQFLLQLPRELDSLEAAAAEQDVARIKQVLHHLRTTISVMGLFERLQSALDDAEYGELPPDSLKQHIDMILFVCREALKEAEQFHKSLQ